MSRTTPFIVTYKGDDAIVWAVSTVEAKRAAVTALNIAKIPAKFKDISSEKAPEYEGARLETNRRPKAGVCYHPALIWTRDL